MKNIIIILFCSIFLYSCVSLTKEERKDIEITVAQKFANYKGVYKKAYRYVNNVTSKKIDPINSCNALNDDLIDSMDMHIIYIEEFKKFTASTPEEFDKYTDEWMESEWKWMSTVRHSFDDKLHAWPTEYNDLDLYNLNYTFNNEGSGSIFTSSEFAVIVPVSPEKNNMPELIDDESFLSGNFNGWVIMFSNHTFEMICAKQFEVENNESLEFEEYGGRRGNLINTLTGNEPEQVIKDDFKDRFKSALDVALENYETYYGGF